MAKLLQRRATAIFFLVAVLTVFSLSTVSGASGAISISQGPLAGQVRATQAKIWLRLSTMPQTGAVVEYGTRFNFFQTPLKTAPRIPAIGSDRTLSILLPGLSPRTTYFYRIFVDGNLLPGLHKFTTNPLISTSRSFRFAVMSDFVNNASVPVMERMATFNPEFLLIIGDFDHRDPGNPTTHPEGPLVAMRTMRRSLFTPGTSVGNSVYKSLINRYPSRQIPLFNMWDDHDYCRNDADKTCPARDIAMKVYRENFLPMSDIPLGRIGLWQNYRYGKEAEIFMLDVRSNRDVATLIDGPGKSMLGAAQKTWIKNKLLNSVATWKIIISPVPFNPGTKPNDSWGAYKTEHDEIVKFIKDNAIKNVVVVTGDIHLGGAIDHGENSGLPEVSVPNANTYTFADTYNNKPGKWTIGPLSGVKSPGFVLVDVGAGGTLSISTRGSDGLVKQFNGTPLSLNLAKQ